MANFVSALTGPQMDDALTQMNQRAPEGWAVGEKDGIPVGSGSLYYHNNAKYYAETAGQTVQQAAQQVVEDATAQAERAEDAANRAEAAVPAGTAGAVFFDRVQTLTEGQKKQARDNIGTDKPSELSSASGDIASFADGSSTPVKDLKATLDVVQPNQYDRPWPAGGGKNICPYENGTATSNGVTFTPQADGSIKISGTATDTATYYFYSNNNILNLPAGESFRMIVTTNGGTGASGLTIAAQSSSGTLANGTDITVTIPAADTNSAARLRVQRNTVIDVIAYPLIMLASQTDTSWVPYSNICPVYPATEVEVSRTGKNLYNIANQTTSANNTYLILGVEANTAYTFSVDATQNALYAQYDNGGTWTTFATAFTKAFLTFNSGTRTKIRLMTYNTSGRPTKFQLELGSAATTYEPYAGQQYLINIGINQWDEEWESGYWNVETGAAVADAAFIRGKNFIPVQPNTTYYLKSNATSSLKNEVLFFDSNKTLLSPSYQDTYGNASFITPNNCAFIKFYMNRNYGTTYNNDISINYPSRFTSYYPYTGHTVYGGELDVTTGVLTETHAAVEMGTLNWNYNSDSGQFYAIISSLKTGYPTSGNYVPIVCSAYATASNPGSSRVTNGKIGTGSAGGLNSKTVVIKDDNYTDTTTFKAAVTGQYIVYELDTPQVIQLTPTEVQTLTGTNNVWADSGAVNVSYWTEGLIEADNLNAVLDSKKVVYASPHTYSKEDALQARLNIGAGSNPNLIMNPWFTVNQRSFTSTSSNNTNTVDRWLAQNMRTSGVCSYSNGIITLDATNAVGGGLTFAQAVDIDEIAGRTVTLSVMLADGSVYSKSIVLPARGTSQTTVISEYIGSTTNIMRLYVNGSTSHTPYNVQLIVPLGNILSIKAVKLELGSVSTLANDAPPNYAEELAKCQRYDNEYINPTAGGYSIFASVSSTTTYADVIIPLPVPMRAKPTATITGGATLFNPSQQYVVVTSITVIGIMNNLLYIRVNASGLTAGMEYRLTLNGSARLSISADL